MLQLPARKTTRLPRFNYIGRTQYFVTLCCFRRQSIFLDQKLSEHLIELLRSESAANSFRIPAYCLMQDHLHFLAEGKAPTCDFLHFLKSFKIKSSRQYSAEFRRVMWQRGFYEHILSSTESVESVAWYIWLNPVKKGLATDPEKYPLSGTLTGLKMPSVWSMPTWCPPWKKQR